MNNNEDKNENFKTNAKNTENNAFSEENKTKNFEDYIKVKDYEIVKDNYFRRYCTLIAFTILFGIGFIIFGTLYTDSNLGKNSYANTLEGGYERAVYDLSDNVNNIEVNLSKTQISNEKVLQKKYMQLVCDNCKYAQSNFQILPISLSMTREGVRFINQMDGYLTSLISADTALTDNQKSKITELYDTTLELKIIINSLIEKVMNGYNILKGSEKDLGELDDFSSNFTGISADSVSYPSMIFDGPFSDSLYNREIKGLPETIIDEDTALDNLQSVIDGKYSYDSIEYEGETNGDFETYDFSIYNGDNVVVAQMAKRGGFLLNLSGYIQENEVPSFDIDDAINSAISFALVAGAGDMQAVWSDESKGIAFINLAPVVNNIVYYPDLIKVKVDMTSGAVVGYDAQSYAYNHTNRTIESPTLSAVQARDLIDVRLNINDQKICVIPLEYGGEVLCYEFYCEYYGNDYFVYINAFNGREERVMKVVSTTDEGALTK